MSGALLGLVALLVVTATLLRWFQLIQRVAIPRRRAGYFALFLLGAALGVVALRSEPGWIGGAAATLAVVVGSIFPLLRLGSRQLATTPAVRVGEPMLAFTALDDAGARFDSVVLAGRPYLLKFFRGHW